MAKKHFVVPERIKRIRKVYKYSQSKLGEILNLPKQSISRIEKGKRTVSEEEIKIIANHFDVPVNAFYEDSWDWGSFQFIARDPESAAFKFEPTFIDIFLEDIDTYCSFTTATHRATYDMLKNKIEFIIEHLNKLLIEYGKKSNQKQ